MNKTYTDISPQVHSIFFYLRWGLIDLEFHHMNRASWPLSFCGNSCLCFRLSLLGLLNVPWYMALSWALQIWTEGITLVRQVFANWAPPPAPEVETFKCIFFFIKSVDQLTFKDYSMSIHSCSDSKICSSKVLTDSTNYKLPIRLMSDPGNKCVNWTITLPRDVRAAGIIVALGAMWHSPHCSMSWSWYIRHPY